MLDKKQIQVIFLFEFKMGCKAAETTHNINSVFGPGTLTNIQCSGGSRSFAKETRSLKLRSVVASYWKLTMTKLEQSSKLILLQLQRLPKNSMTTILRSFGIWSKLKRWKSSLSGCLILLLLLLGRFSRVQLCETPDGSPRGSSVPGILQARTLEWVAISFSNAWKEKWKWSHSVMSNS